MIKTVAGLGAGTIGHTVAAHFAINGYFVNLYDPNPKATRTAQDCILEELAVLAEEGLITKSDIGKFMRRITVTRELHRAVAGADHIVESAPEDLDLKQKLLCEVEKFSRPGVVIGSNTSSLKFADITKKMTDEGKARTMLIHWYNPGHIVPMIELSFFGNMDEALYKEVEQLYIDTGKRPVKVLKDVPGLVANRLQHAVAREVFAMMEAGVASAADIDRALKYGPAFRYATTGQLEIADFVGLDMWCKAADNLLPDLDDAKKANPMLKKKVKEGKLGVKSGEGFFSWPQKGRSEARKAFNRRLLKQMLASKEYDK